MSEDAQKPQAEKGQPVRLGRGLGPAGSDVGKHRHAQAG
jgi:hypothetical protein